MFKKIALSILLVSPLLIVNYSQLPVFASSPDTQVSTVSLAFLKESLLPGTPKEKIKERLGTDFTEGINHINGHELWSYKFGKVKDYKFSGNKDAVDIEGIKTGQLEYQVSITFNINVLENVLIYFLGENGQVEEYYKSDSGYVRDPSSNITKPVNNKFIDFGDRGELVKKIQYQLMSHGFSLPLYGNDGIFGAETEKAVREFQKYKNILVDGIVGPITLEKLDISTITSENSLYPDKLIKVGSKGENVKKIQKVVNVEGDGIFGPKTENAVKRYQKNNNLVVDGIIGKNTWGRMF